MAAPLTGQQLAALAAEVDKPGPHHFAKADVVAALDLITRLRSDLALRDAAFDAVLAMDDDVNTLFSLGQVARTYTRVLATPACSCRAEAVHQAGCDTDRHA